MTSDRFARRGLSDHFIITRYYYTTLTRIVNKSASSLSSIRFNFNRPVLLASFLLSPLVRRSLGQDVRACCSSTLQQRTSLTNEYIYILLDTRVLPAARIIVRNGEMVKNNG